MGRNTTVNPSNPRNREQKGKRNEGGSGKGSEGGVRALSVGNPVEGVVRSGWRRKTTAIAKTIEPQQRPDVVVVGAGAGGCWAVG
eukprot:scaffold74308_cov26-Tisochrysis_lutea.AAC.1